jgi:hypothetical protein
MTHPGAVVSSSSYSPALRPGSALRIGGRDGNRREVVILPVATNRRYRRSHSHPHSPQGPAQFVAPQRMVAPISTLTAPAATTSPAAVLAGTSTAKASRPFPIQS